MQWFRLYSEFATDPKVQLMSEAMQRRLVMLMCFQCCNGIETFHETLRETSIRFMLRITSEEMSSTKEEFVRLGFINEHWILQHWAARQYVSDSSTERVRRHRDKLGSNPKKDHKTNPVSVTFQKRSCNAPEQNRTDTDTDTSYIVHRRAEERKKSTRFADFWKIYPIKKGRAAAEAKWVSKNYDGIADKIISDVQKRALSDRQWLDGYIPHGSTYVNQHGWEDDIEPVRSEPRADIMSTAR